MIYPKVASIVLLAGFFSGACQPRPDSQALPTTVIPQIQTATGDLIAPTPGVISTSEAIDNFEEVSISVEGLELMGSFFAPTDREPPWPGLILLHMLHGDRSSWDAFVQDFNEAGYAVLSVDLRGHGETGGEVNWDLAVADLQQVWDYLSEKPEIDRNHIAIIGESIGANLALISASNEPGFKTAILLSPGLNYSGVETEAAMLGLLDKPVLIVASRDDAYAADSASTLKELAAQESQLIVFDNAGHGIHMLNNEPGLLAQIIEWLHTTVE